MVKNPKLSRGKYTFKDLDTGKLITVSSINATNAVRKLNRKLKKKVNYYFIGFKKR